MKKQYFKPEIPKINPEIDLPEDSVYRSSFPCNNYLWSINEGHIKTKDGKKVTIEQCKIYQSEDIYHLVDLLKDKVIVNPYYNPEGRYQIIGHYILIQDVHIIEATDNYPSHATINYRKLNDDFEINHKHGLFHFTDLTIVKGKICHVWEDWNSRFPFKLEYPNDEILTQINKKIELQALRENKMQYSLF